MKTRILQESLALLLLVLTGGACMSTCEVPIDEALKEYAGELDSSRGLRTMGYTIRGNEPVTFRASATRQCDKLHFERRARRGKVATEPEVVPIRAIESVQVLKFNPLKTAAAIAVSPLIALFGVWYLFSR